MLYQSIKEHVSRDVVQIAPDTDISTAMQLMARSKINCILVCEHKKPVGILTTRDLLSLYHKNHVALDQPVSKIMTREVITSHEEITLLDTFDLMIQNSIRHIPIVDENDHLSGIISETDIMESLGSIDLMRMQTVAEIMMAPVTTVNVETPFSEVIQLFHNKKIGSVVVKRNGLPVGIITERDIPALISNNTPVSTESEQIMSQPVITIAGKATSQEALIKMHEHGIHHLVVTDDSSAILGIVSRSSYFHNLTRYLIRQLIKSETRLKQLLGKTEKEIIHHQVVEMGNFYFSAIQNAPQGIIVHQHGKIVYANRAAIVLFGGRGSKSNLTGHPFLSLVHPDSYQAALKRTENLYLTGGETPFINEKLLTKDGNAFAAETSSVLIPYDGDTSILVTIKDITEKLMLEEQLMRAQKLEAIGTLVGGIAHDFNNTLAGITGNVFLAKMALHENGNPASELDHVEKLAFHASEMIQQLLAFARKTPIKIKPLLLADFIKEAIKLHRAVIPKNIMIKTKLAPESLVIQGDPSQLQQVLINLINNARHAVNDVIEPTIIIKLEKFQADSEFMERHQIEPSKADFARLTVYDNGYGIPEQIQPHLFEPFYTTKEVGEGSGLGLAMVYGAIKSHDGIIEVESQEKCCTAFHLYFPLAKADNETGASDPLSEIKKGDGETILLVDDQEVILETGREVLKQLNYRVLTAFNGEEAVRVFREHAKQIQLTILDLVMPKMGGVDAAKMIFEIDPDAKILFATGHDSKGTLVDGDMGEVLSKPFAISKLSQAIRDTLQS